MDQETRVEQGTVGHAEEHGQQKGHALDSPVAKYRVRLVCRKDEWIPTRALGRPCAGIP